MRCNMVLLDIAEGSFLFLSLTSMMTMIYGIFGKRFILSHTTVQSDEIEIPSCRFLQ